jgi:hypothetical protein
LLLFAAFRLMNPTASDSTDQIVISDGLIEHLGTNFARTWQRPPDQSEMIGLVREYIRDEVAYREALNLGLDRDDAIVRRRMRQKLEFLYEDALSTQEVTDEALETFLQENRDDYAFDPELALLQIYINPDRHEEPSAYADRLLEDLRGLESLPTDPSAYGDGLMLPSELDRSPLWQIRRSFGEDFARALVDLKTGSWEGPIVSGYGLHLVCLLEKQEGRDAKLHEVRDSVLRDWTVQRKTEALDKLYQEMIKGYEVVFEGDDLAAALDE